MDSPRSLTVVVVDDAKVVCSRIAEFVETIEGVRVAGTANSIQEALDCITHLEPDILIQDINMPRFGLLQNGIDMLRWTKEHYPATKVIVLSIHTDDLYRRTCHAFGAYAFISKATGTELLAETLIQLVTEHASS